MSKAYLEGHTDILIGPSPVVSDGACAEECHTLDGLSGGYLHLEVLTIGNAVGSSEDDWPWTTEEIWRIVNLHHW